VGASRIAERLRVPPSSRGRHDVRWGTSIVLFRLPCSTSPWVSSPATAGDCGPAVTVSAISVALGVPRPTPGSARWPADGGLRPCPARGHHHRCRNIGASIGRLRQYFPVGTDLTVHSAADLDWFAGELNGLLRKRLAFHGPTYRIWPLPGATNPCLGRLARATSADRPRDTRSPEEPGRAQFPYAPPAALTGTSGVERRRRPSHILGFRGSSLFRVGGLVDLEPCLTGSGGVAGRGDGGGGSAGRTGFERDVRGGVGPGGAVAGGLGGVRPGSWSA
jgi:hypothetical protein